MTNVRSIILQKKNMDFRNYIKKFALDGKYIPSFSEIAKDLSISKDTVHRKIKALCNEGLLRKEGSRFFPSEQLSGVPYFESIRAGFPSPAEDDTKFMMNLNDYLIDHPYATYTVKVSGDSMIGANIAPGDIVIVDKSKKHKSGDIIIARVDGEYTLKYIIKEPGRVFLRAANEYYPDIFPGDELEVNGVITGVIRKIC